MIDYPSELGDLLYYRSYILTFSKMLEYEKDINTDTMRKGKKAET
jgi:hypothetical protein